MPKSSPTGGCRKILRRSFLFLLGLAAAKLLSEYFSIQQNRNNFIKLVSQLWQKAIAQLDSSQPKVTTKPLPNNRRSQTSVTTEPLNPPQSPQLTTATPKRVAPVQVSKKTVAGVSFYQTTIDFTDRRREGVRG